MTALARRQLPKAAAALDAAQTRGWRGRAPVTISGDVQAIFAEGWDDHPALAETTPRCRCLAELGPQLPASSTPATVDPLRLAEAALVQELHDQRRATA